MESRRAGAEGAEEPVEVAGGSLIMENLSGPRISDVERENYNPESNKNKGEIKHLESRENTKNLEHFHIKQLDKKQDQDTLHSTQSSKRDVEERVQSKPELKDGLSSKNVILNAANDPGEKEENKSKRLWKKLHTTNTSIHILKDNLPEKAERPCEKKQMKVEERFHSNPELKDRLSTKNEMLKAANVPGEKGENKRSRLWKKLHNTNQSIHIVKDKLPEKTERPWKKKQLEWKMKVEKEDQMLSPSQKQMADTCFPHLPPALASKVLQLQRTSCQEEDRAAGAGEDVTVWDCEVCLLLLLLDLRLSYDLANIPKCLLSPLEL